MATAKPAATTAETKTEPKAAPKVADMPSLRANPVEPADPYPTGDPQGPQTWAEINGLVPVGTGPLVPANPPAKGG